MKKTIKTTNYSSSGVGKIVENQCGADKALKKGKKAKKLGEIRRNKYINIRVKQTLNFVEMVLFGKI